MYVDSLAHGFSILLALFVVAVLVFAVAQIRGEMRRQRERERPGMYWQKLPLGKPVKIAPSRWMVRVAPNEAVIGRTPEQALELAELPKWSES